MWMFWFVCVGTASEACQSW